MRIEYMKIFVEDHESEDSFWKAHRNEGLDIQSIDGRNARFNDFGFPIECDVCGKLIFEDEDYEELTGMAMRILEEAGETPDHPSGYSHAGENHPCQLKLEQMRKEAKECGSGSQ